jgi:uncharacterized membrane protein
MTKIEEITNGCDVRNKKKVDGPKEDEWINWRKLRGMGMMGEWMEAKTQLSIQVKLIINFPLGACWEGWDVW